jgi:hypothetical protein
MLELRRVLMARLTVLHECECFSAHGVAVFSVRSELFEGGSSVRCDQVLPGHTISVGSTKWQMNDGQSCLFFLFFQMQADQVAGVFVLLCLPWHLVRLS